MRNLSRILCGILSFVWLGQCTTPPLESHTGDQNVARVRPRGHAVHLGSEPLSNSLLQETSLPLSPGDSKTEGAAGRGHLRQIPHETHVEHLHSASDRMESMGTVALLRSKLQLRVSRGAGDVILMVGIIVIMVCFLVLLINSGESDDDVKLPDSSDDGRKNDNRLPTIKEVDSSRTYGSDGSSRATPGCDNCGYPITDDSSLECSNCGMARPIANKRQITEHQHQEQRTQAAPKLGDGPIGYNLFQEMKSAVRESAERNAAPQQDDQAAITDVEFSDGSWAKAYREARGQRREALELLFRCNIISTQEFAYSRVSQEHIDECVWIGTYMLKQKPLEEWVALWQQAQQTFEDSVTACFTARTDARTWTGNSGPLPGDALPGEAGASASQAYIQQAQEDPYQTQSSLCMSQLLSLQNLQAEAYPQGMSSVPQSQQSLGGDSAPDDGMQRERIVSPMILRCREIMNAPPQEGVPAPRIPVMRSSSSATTVPVAGFTPPPAFRPMPEALSEASITPSMKSLSPSLPLISPPEPSAFPSMGAYTDVGRTQQSVADLSGSAPMQAQKAPQETTILPSAARIMAQQAQQASAIGDREHLLSRIEELERQRNIMELQRDQALLSQRLGSAASDCSGAMERQDSGYLRHDQLNMTERSMRHDQLNMTERSTATGLSTTTGNLPHEQSAAQLTEVLLSQMRGDQKAQPTVPTPLVDVLAEQQSRIRQLQQDLQYGANGSTVGAERPAATTPAEVYKELERMEIELQKVRDENSRLKEEKAACEEAHARDVSTLEAMLSQIMSEKQRLTKALAESEARVKAQGSFITPTKVSMPPTARCSSDDKEDKFSDHSFRSIRSVMEPAIEPDIDRSCDFDRRQYSVS